MSETYVTEFEDEDVVDDDVNDEEPVEESAEEYGYVEPPIVPAPDTGIDQNPGFTEGVHV